MYALFTKTYSKSSMAKGMIMETCLPLWSELRYLFFCKKWWWLLDWFKQWFGAYPTTIHHLSTKDFRILLIVSDSHYCYNNPDTLYSRWVIATHFNQLEPLDKNETQRAPFPIYTNWVLGIGKSSLPLFHVRAITHQCPDFNSDLT